MYARLANILIKYPNLKDDPRIGSALSELTVRRAVTEAEIEKYGSYGSLILRVKPGITGWWQVMGRNQTTWDHRTRLEVYYVSNWSLWMDGYIALKTIWVIISGQGR